MSRWLGTLEIGDGWARWQGVAGDAALHAHTAAQAVLGECECEAKDADGRRVHGHGLLVDPMAVHRLVGGAPVTLVFLEPWTTSAALPPALAATLAALPAATPVLAAPHRPPWWTAWRHAPPAADPAAPWSQSARDFIEHRLPHGRVHLDDLAAHLGLSADHTRHRLADTLGLPFKRYVLWRRLRLAALALGRGLDATAAAHDAGFADSAHLARTLRAMFGVTVTQALRAA